MTSFAITGLRARRRRRRPDPHAPFLWRRIAIFGTGCILLAALAGLAWTEGDEAWAGVFVLGATTCFVTAWESWLLLICGQALGDDDPETAQRALEDANRMGRVVFLMWPLTMGLQMIVLLLTLTGAIA